MFLKHNMPKVRKNYFTSIIKPEAEDFNHFTIACENEAGRHVYRPLGECSLREAKIHAQALLEAHPEYTVVYVYTEYCPECSPDVCAKPYLHTLQPATHLDYIAKYTR